MTQNQHVEELLPNDREGVLLILDETKQALSKKGLLIKQLMEQEKTGIVNAAEIHLAKQESMALRFKLDFLEARLRRLNQADEESFLE